jgi:hypothetical protein
MQVPRNRRLLARFREPLLPIPSGNNAVINSFLTATDGILMPMSEADKDKLTNELTNLLLGLDGKIEGEVEITLEIVAMSPYIVPVDRSRRWARCWAYPKLRACLKAHAFWTYGTQLAESLKRDP